MDIQLYQRQIHPELLDIKEQELLAQKSVFVLGLGGLGSAVSMYLAVSGVGTLVLCDHDVIETSNLNRQVLHPRDRIGMKKVQSARMTLEALNPDCRYVTVAQFIDTPELLCSHAESCSVLVDCTDNLEARRLLSRASAMLNIPLVHGGIRGFSGQVSVFYPEDKAKLESFLPPVSEPGMVPVLGAAAGVIGSMEALEVIKVLLGRPSELRDKVLIYDGAEATVFSYGKI